ncbi:MAG TPA: hypothetical protein VFP65_19850 [Anaeromyxobacteraceae bacterium]|nr:hypothetical protein [Anaeromyxobacteraceae bacterium]
MDSTALIASVKRRASIPTTQATLSTTDLLGIADEETLGYVMPILRDAREDYGIAAYEVPIQDGVLVYRLPPRALAGVLRELMAIRLDGTAFNLPRIAYGQISYSSGPGFTTDGNTIVLVTDQPGNVTTLGTTLRMTYYQRPSSLVVTSAVGTVSSFNTGTNAVTLSAAPPGTFTTAVKYDLVRAGSPFETLATDLVATTVVGSTLTFTSALPSDLGVGDYVTLAGQTAVPQVPVELHPLLCQSVAVKILHGMCDYDAVDKQTAELMRMEGSIRKLLTGRVEEEPMRVVSRSNPFRNPWW